GVGEVVVLGDLVEHARHLRRILVQVCPHGAHCLTIRTRRRTRRINYLLMSANFADPAHTPLVARTVAIADPGDLLDYLPSPTAADALAWVRGGTGVVGIGERMRITTAGMDRFTEADSAFAELVSRAVVRDDVARPGTGPIAFGSFAFSGHSEAGGV